MNPKQAIALALGLIAAVTLVMLPRQWQYTRPRHISTRTMPDGSIETVYRSKQIFWQPMVFGLVVLTTGFVVYRLRKTND